MTGRTGACHLHACRVSPDQALARLSTMKGEALAAAPVVGPQ
jgi:hypothetical protein